MVEEKFTIANGYHNVVSSVHLRYSRLVNSLFLLLDTRGMPESSTVTRILSWLISELQK